MLAREFNVSSSFQIGIFFRVFGSCSECETSESMDFGVVKNQRRLSKHRESSALGNDRLSEKVLRAYFSRRKSDGGIEAFKDICPRGG